MKFIHFIIAASNLTTNTNYNQNFISKLKSDPTESFASIFHPTNWLYLVCVIPPRVTPELGRRTH